MDAASSDESGFTLSHLLVIITAAGMLLSGCVAVASYMDLPYEPGTDGTCQWDGFRCENAGR